MNSRRPYHYGRIRLRAWRVARAFCIALLFGLGGVAAADADLESIRAMVKVGQLKEAIVSIKALLARTPDDPQARFLYGVALAEDGQVDVAIGVFEALTRDFPRLPEPHNNLAVLHASKGDYERARDALLVAINTHPSYATAHENLGDIYAKMARIAYDRALSLNNGSLTAQAKLNLLRDLFSVRVSAAEIGARSTPAKTTPVSTTPVRAVAKVEPAAGGLPARTGGAQISADRVAAAVQGWAAAWSRQDVPAYFNYYSARFKPPGGLSREAWQAERGKRIRRPKYIEVKVSDFNVQPGGLGQVLVTFEQLYRSNTFRDQVRKRLDLVWIDERLQIVAERILK